MNLAFFVISIEDCILSLVFGFIFYLSILISLPNVHSSEQNGGASSQTTLSALVKF